MPNKFPNSSRGVVAPDPTASAPVGLKIDFNSILFRMEKSVTGGMSPLTVHGGAMLIMSFRDNDGHHSLGSAAMVGPGLAICAYHVVEPYWDHIQTGNAAMYCDAPAPDVSRIWRVERVTRIERTDLAVLSMTLNCELPSTPLLTFAMNTLMPLLGDQVLVCGFSATQLTQPKVSSVSVEVKTRCVSGHVTDIYSDGRDQVMVPGPAFGIECESFGGMSGGPVFDANGRLIGIVSSSIDGDSASCASHIWPALIVDIEPLWPLGLLPARASLLGLRSRYGVHIQHPDAFVPSVIDGQYAVVYSPNIRTLRSCR